MTIRKETLLLRIYAMTLTALVIVFMISGFTNHRSSQNFEEITVERINVVEPNGTLKMVISNQERQHPGMMEGQILGTRNRPAGIIFFNEEQDEVGGLIYQGSRQGGASWVLSVDQYKNDQVMQMRYLSDSSGHNSYGLQLWDRDWAFTLPRVIRIMDSLQGLSLSNAQIHAKLTEMNQGRPVGSRRMFLGRSFEQETGLFIQDEYGIDRLRIYIDENNAPRIELLDKSGTVIKDLAAG